MIGYSIWTEERHDHRDDPIGGVIVAVWDLVDLDSGEMTTKYRVIDPYHTRPTILMHTMTASEVTVTEEPEYHRLSLLIRRLAEDLAFSGPGKYRKGRLTTRELEMIDWIVSLARVAKTLGVL